MENHESNIRYLETVDDDEKRDDRRLEAKWLANGLFVPTWDNKPLEKKPIVLINGVSVLSFQNLSCIIAQPGAGKSSVIECIISSVLNKECDSIGLETGVERLMYIDFERTDNDVWRSFDRVMKRAKIPKGTNTKNVQILGFRNMYTAKDRKERIELLLKHYEPELLLLDGVGDLVNDTNSQDQAIECKNWIRKIASEYNVSILTTLHPNKGSLTPRGHIGSEMLRESEDVLVIKVNADEIRTLTTDFEHGKGRNSGHATTCFKWCDEKMYFVKNDILPKEQHKKLTPIEKLSEEEIISLIQNTHIKELNSEDTKTAISSYLKRFFTYVKTSNKDVNDFIKYLEKNNYLIREKSNKDSRTMIFKMNEIYK